MVIQRLSKMFQMITLRPAFFVQTRKNVQAIPNASEPVFDFRAR